MTLLRPIVAILCLLAFSFNSHTQCNLDDITVQEGACDDGTPDITIFFDISGGCTATEVCFNEDGTDIGCAEFANLEIGDGQGVNFQFPAADAFYQFTITLSDGSSYDGYSYLNGDCDGSTGGCLNPFATNYDPDATDDDGSCVYADTICDCADTEHTLGVLTWLGDTFDDQGGTTYLWDDQSVDFNCADWGYDCGDIAGAPTDDPNGVCDGNLPPNNGCAAGEPCAFISLELEEICEFDNDTQEWIVRIGATPFFTGDCDVLELCEQGTGMVENCYSLPDNDIFLASGEGVNVTVEPNSTYTVTMTTDNETISQTIIIGDCLDAVTGCMNPFATNYNPDAVEEDGSCIYDENICDCAGSEHTIGVLAWLGDTFDDQGGTTYLWDDQTVDFNCSDWGYDCGDIAGAPTDDPYDVCDGNLPPSNGCATGELCILTSLELEELCEFDETNQEWIVRINAIPFFTGDCDILELCEQGAGMTENCYSLPDNDIFLASGEGVNVVVEPNNTYTVTMSTGTGTISETITIGDCLDAVIGCMNPFATNYNPDAVDDDGSCVYDDTICDCAGTEHTLGVLTWLGDTYGDTGDFEWDEQPVDFDCADWGYDCGDIDGAPTDDPYGVCNGDLPPNNGCESDVCAISISQVSPICLDGELSLNMNFNVQGSCAFADLCYSVDGGLVECVDWSWASTSLGINFPSPAENAEIVFTMFLSDGTLSAPFTYQATDCETVGNDCVPVGMTFTQQDCADNNEDGVFTPTIGLNFAIAGDCIVEDLCYTVNGQDLTCFTLADFDLLIANGEGINLINTVPNAIYEVYFTTVDGISGVQTFTNGNCDSVTPGCTNEYADNYSPNADQEDGSCTYSENICDCAGTELSIGVLSWLGDEYGDVGGAEYFWDGLPVDFDCSTWGYDCGDIVGAPDEDPFEVCLGNLPPDNGCSEQCSLTSLELEEQCEFDEDLQVWVSRVLITTNYTGECDLTTVCEQGLGGVENCYSLTDAEIFLESGEGLVLTVDPNNTYTITMSTGTDEISGTVFIGDCTDATFGCTNPYADNYDANADEEDGSCTYTETICDCAGTEHTIGVLTWLGDGFEDVGDFDWDEQPVDFNCTLWGYDCGDIDAQGDPYNVCGGGLPPNNGCGVITDVFGCTDAVALNYNEDATVDDGTCEYPVDVYGCTDADASNYNELATIDNGTCEYDILGCTDSEATNYNPLANVNDGTCIYTEIMGCTNPNANNYDPFATIDDGSCEFGCDIPVFTIESICEDGVNTGFFLDLTVTDIGTGAPYTVTNNSNNQNLILTAVGTYTFGPFTNNASVVLIISSNEVANCTTVTQVYTYSCADDVVLGCTNPNAINFNAEANLDDGSCVFDCVYPILTYETFCEDDEEDMFYVNMTVESLGNGAPYDITNNATDENIILSFIGTIQLGPYANDAQVVYVVESQNIQGCLITSPVLTDNCVPVIIAGCTDPIATNYNELADEDDGSCTYDFEICDCSGNIHSPAVLMQLGDGIANEGNVDFNCAIWAYDCGDIAGAPDEDLYGVCNGNLPPLNGCTDNVNELSVATLNIFPNPTNGKLNITTEGFSSQFTVEVYNSVGALVYSEKHVNSGTVNINLESSATSSGIYFLRVFDQNLSLEKPIRIEK